MAIRIGTSTPSKLYLGVNEVTKAYLGATEVYSTGGGIWTPAELPSLALWLDADDSDTITLNGSNVSQWDDKSPKGRNFTQPTASIQPAYLSTGLGEKPSVYFDNATKFIAASTASDWTFLHEAGGSAIFLVIQLQPLGTTAPRYILITRSSPTGILHGIRDLSSGAFPLGTLFENGSTTLPYSPAPAASTPVNETHIIEWEHGLARTNDFGIYVDGVEKANVNYTTAPVGGFTADAPLRFGSAQMYAGEMVVLDVLPSTEDRQKMEGYLAWKWGGITSEPETRAWIPSDLGADLAAWYDADDSDTVTLNGSTVSQLDDKSGNNRNMIQATAASQPVYSATDYNGKPVLQFNGTSHFLSAGNQALQSTGLNVIVVGDYTDQNFFIGEYSPSAGREWLLRSEQYLVFEDIDASNPDNWATGTNQAGKHILEGIFTNGSTAEFWSDGNLIATAVQAVTDIGQGNAQFYIGRYLNVYSNCDISEVVITGADLIATDRQKLEGYLAHKWGLTANLPVDHPYKDAAPTVAI